MRTERDSLGTITVPSDAYWGAQTERARENFSISGRTVPKELIHVYALLKQAAATVNVRYGLEKKKGQAILFAAAEVASGKLDKHFPLDIFQSGAGTSTNMNLNEVIARRAEEILGAPVHPNDDVNRSQSTNDTYPSAMQATIVLESAKLLPVLSGLQKSLEERARLFKAIKKTGRTHVQDAVPLTVGQEMGGWAHAVAVARDDIEAARERLRELPLGGTAVGTGENAPKGYAEATIREFNRLTEGKFVPAPNRFSAQQNPPVLAFSASLRGLAVTLNRICNDLVLLSSGPNGGIGELQLPAVQPGSSIMPGKVNPSMCEFLNMVCFRVIGNDATVLECARSGQLELNVYMPLEAATVIESVQLLTQAILLFERKCVRGLKVREKRVQENLEKNPIVATALAPVLGYEKTAALVKESFETGMAIRALLQKKGLLTKEIERLLKV